MKLRLRLRRNDRSLVPYLALCALSAIWVGLMLRVILGTGGPSAGSAASRIGLSATVIVFFLLTPPVLVSARRLRDGSSTVLGPTALIPTAQDDGSVLMWSTDAELRMQDAFGGGVSTLSAASGRVTGMPLSEFFGDLRADSTLVDAHRLALAGERAPVEFRSEGMRFQGTVRPIHRDGGIVGVAGIAMDAMTRPDERTIVLEPASERLIDLVDAEAEILLGLA